MITLTAEQSAVVTWMATKFSPPADISYSVEEVQNQGGTYRVRSVTFSRGIDSCTSNLDADLTLPNGPSVAMVRLRQMLDHVAYPPWEPYPRPSTAAPPPPAPPAPQYQTTIVDANHHIETETKTGKTRRATLTPFGWEDGDWE